MAAASMLIHVTHIDDSIRGLQGPCVYFWGMTHDRSLYLTMELYLESIRQSLETKLPPLNLHVLENMQVCCVLINHRWQRARIPELKLSHLGTVEVFCIDSGDTHSVPLALVRTLDIPGYEAENIRECPPLANKFILADIVAPCGPINHNRQWSELAIMFLKINVENHTWKAAPMGMYGTHQGVRLFDSNNQLLATIMIQQGLGIAAQTYHEALSMCDVMNKQPAYMKPAFYSSPAMKLFPAGCNMAALSNPVRPTFAIPVPPQEQFAPPATAYTINNLPVNGRHDVIVSHISDGPLKFFVQMKREANIFLNIRKKLDAIVPQPFHGTPLGSPCMALSPIDKLFHRGLITGVKDYDTPCCTCTVYFVDIGTKYAINRSVICAVPDELLVPSLCAYPVSLFGVQEFSNLCGLAEIFTSFVNAANNLQVEVVLHAKQEVNLYDHTGRSIRDMLFSILSGLEITTNTPSTVSSTIADMPSLNLAAEESLFVSYTDKPGYFFGQLERISLSDSKTGLGIKCLTEMADELSKAYSSEPNPPLLYRDVESRLGHYGVVIWDVDQVCYRVLVTKELLGDAEVQFIDYGNSIWMPRDKILAPLGHLTRFRQSSYGINCELDGGVKLSLSKWSQLILDKWIKVKLGKCIEGVYSVTFTSDACNSEIVKILASSVSPKFEEDVGKTNPTIETSRPVSAQLLSPLASIAITDSRFIKSSENGSYSVTFTNKSSNKQAVIETIDENARAGSHCIVNSGKRLNFQPVTGIDNSEDPLVIERKVSAAGKPLVSIYARQFSSSTSNEKPRIQKEIDQPLFTESMVLQKPDVGLETSKIEVPEIQKQYVYPKQPVLTGLEKQIEVVFGNDPSDFYVHLSESFATLEDLAKKLNLVYSDESKPALLNPERGSACVVQYEEDNLWYRGQIEKLYDSNLLVPLAIVFFVDYGNTQRCPLKQIKAVDEEFARLHPQAFRCRFNGTDVLHASSTEERNQFENCCVGQTLTVTFVKQDVETKYSICLVEKSEEGAVSINDRFEKPILASVAPPDMVYAKLPISETSMDVTVTNFTNFGQLYLRPFDFAAYQKQLVELEQFYATLSPNELLEDQPKKGLPCVVRSSEEERYYRSEILSIHDEMAAILFVDSGIQQDTPLSQLKRITPRFMALPRLTWYCQLKEVKLNSPICEELQKHLRASILNKDKASALFHPVSSEGTSEMVEVELTLPTIGNLSQYLVQHDTLEHATLVSEVEMVAQNVNFSPGQIVSTQAITFYAKSPTEFWVQFEPETVQDIMARIDKWAVDPEFIKEKNFIASVGKPCLAFYNEDGRWYRALVEDLHENFATVCYIDYGNSCIVKTCDLRGLTADLAEAPALAYKCCQEGAEVFPVEIAELYVQVILEETASTVKFMKVVDGVFYVRIFLSSGVDLGDLCRGQSAELTLTKVSVEESTENLVQDMIPTSILPNSHGEGTVEVTVNTSTPDVLGHAEESSLHLSPRDYSVLPEKCTEPVIPELVTAIEHVEGYIVFCISPMQFWFQTKEDEVMLNKIQVYLSEHHKKDCDAFQIEGKPVVGQIYGVNHPMYEGCYRGRIEKATEATFEVHFIDYGDSHTISLENICDLPREWADIPPLAVRCSWKGSINWSQAAMDKFNAACIDPEKLCRVGFEAEEEGVRYVHSLFVAEKNMIDLLEAEC